VCLDAADDFGHPFLFDSMPRQDSPGQPGAFLRMTDPAVGPVLLFSADVMEQRGQFQDLKVCPFLPADAETELVDPLGMIPIVAAPRMTEVGHRFLPDGLERRRLENILRSFSVTSLDPGFIAIIHLESISHLFVRAVPAVLL